MIIKNNLHVDMSDATIRGFQGAIILKEMMAISTIIDNTEGNENLKKFFYFLSLFAQPLQTQY